MVSNKQNLNQVGIDELFRALLSLGVKKDDIRGEPLKIKYSNVPPYSAHQRHSTKTKYKNEEEDDNKEVVRSPSNTHQVHKNKNHYLQACHRIIRAMFTSHLGASLTFSMFINLLIKLLLTILFYFILYISFYSHFNLFNNIDIVVSNIE